MTERQAEVVHRSMLQRPVDPGRYRGLVRPDKAVRWAVHALEEVEHLRGRPADAWPTATALPEALDQLARQLVELGWDDLASLARREELAVYRELEAGRPGAFRDRIAEALAALRSTLVDVERYEEALEAVEELVRLRSGDDRSGQVVRDAVPEAVREAVREARSWRTVLLARLGRHAEAVESAAVAVAEIRGRLRRRGDASVDLELSHALAAYADQLDVVGRVAEAAEVTAEVVAYWRERPDSTAQFLTRVDLLSDRLVRSGRTEEAGACVTEAMEQLRQRAPHHELAGTWRRFSARLLALGLPEIALEAGEKAVKLSRELARRAREEHREVEAADDWDDDHRYSEWYLLQRRRAELESSHEAVRRAERNLCDGLLGLSACLRRLDRVAEATAADAEAAALNPQPEAAALTPQPAGSSGHVPPDPA